MKIKIKPIILLTFSVLIVTHVTAQSYYPNNTYQPIELGDIGYQKNIANLIENPMAQVQDLSNATQIYLSARAPSGSQLFAQHLGSNTKILLSETALGFYEAQMIIPKTSRTARASTEHMIRWEISHRGQLGVKTTNLNSGSSYSQYEEHTQTKKRTQEVEPLFGMIVRMERAAVASNQNGQAKHSQEANLGGVAVGALIGGVIGNQFGKGTGKDLATVTGVVGGALLGNEIAKQHSQQKAGETAAVPTNTPWIVTVELENGQQRTFSYPKEPFFYLNQTVRIENNQLMDRYSRKGPFEQP